MKYTKNPKKSPCYKAIGSKPIGPQNISADKLYRPTKQIGQQNISTDKTCRPKKNIGRQKTSADKKYRLTKPLGINFTFFKNVEVLPWNG